jgi:hypothetical protein
MLAEFETHGHTYTQHAAGTFVVLTREPENIQALLGTRFRDFDLGGDRRGNFSALAGQGVFTQEGEAWAQSRALLRWGQFHRFWGGLKWADRGTVDRSLQKRI